MFPPPPFPLCINLREPTASALRGATLGARIKKYRSSLMPLVHGRKKSTLARSLVLSVKLDARFLAAVAARVPSSKSHIPFISRLRTSFISFQLSFSIPFKASPIPIINLFFTAIAFKSCSDKVRIIFPSSPTTSNVVLLCLPT